MAKLLPPRRARLCGWLLALAVVAGCGREERAQAPRPNVRAAWVSDVRRNAAKAVAGGDSAGAQNFDGWGHLKGRIVVVGALPPLPALSGAAQDKYCGALPKPPTNEAIVVGPDNGLKDVALYLTNKGVPSHESYKATAADLVVLNNQGCRFEPHVCLLRTTQSLRVKNSDGVGHNTKYNSLNQPFNENVPVGGGITKELRIEERSPTRYNCDVHKWMDGHLVLRASPYMAKTGPDGTFEMKFLPAGGALEIQIWHEKSPTGLTGELKEVTGAAKPVTIDKRGRLSVTIPKDEKTISFTLEVPASAVGG